MAAAGRGINRLRESGGRMDEEKRATSAGLDRSIEGVWTEAEMGKT
jgi:hypothetical protein